MHLATRGTEITRILQAVRPEFRDRNMGEDILAIVEYARLMGGTSLHETRARRPADRRLAIGGVKRRGFRADAIEVRRVQRFTEYGAIFPRSDAVIETEKYDVLAGVSHVEGQSVRSVRQKKP